MSTDVRNEWLLEQLKEFIIDEPAQVIFKVDMATSPLTGGYVDEEGFGVLNFSPRYDTPLHYDEASVAQTLSIGGEEHYCEVPWDAVVVIRNQWRSVLVHGVGAVGAPAAKQPKKKTNPFQVIQGGKTDDPAEDEDA